MFLILRSGTADQSASYLSNSLICDLISVIIELAGRRIQTVRLAELFEKDSCGRAAVDFLLPQDVIALHTGDRLTKQSLKVAARPVT